MLDLHIRVCGDFFKDFKEVHQAQEKQGNANLGHGVDHDLRVAQNAALLVDDPHLALLGWVAGLLHSTDRFCPKGTSDAELESILRERCQLLPQNIVDARDINLVIDAVITHHLKNDEMDNPVTVILKDADRLANLAPDTVIRTGQFFATKPVFVMGQVDRPHPSGTYKNPACCLDDLYYMFEWALGAQWWTVPESQQENYARENTWFRNQRAQAIASGYVKFLLGFLKELTCDLDRCGLRTFSLR